MAEKKMEEFKKIVWEISDLSKQQIESYENGEEIESKTFKIVFGDIETKWTLSLYPNGNRIETKSHIGLFLTLKESTSFNFDASFKPGITSKEVEKTFFKNLVRAGDKLKTNGWGIEKLINHAQLFDPDGKFFIDGKFFLVCELTLTRSEVTSIKKRINLNENLASDFKKMFENKILSDFELISRDGHAIKAHKVILAARSPVFFAMLNTPMEEAEKGSVNIPDFGTKTLKELLRFIYCNEVEDIDGIARELIFAAEKYDLEPLKHLCVESVNKSLTIENVVETLLMANSVSRTEQLFEKCLMLVVVNYQHVSKTENWKTLPNNVLNKIIDHAISGVHNIFI